MKLSLLFLSLILMLMPAAAQAQKACTEMWCQEGTTLNLEDGPWPPGAYRFTISADEQKIECTGKLPFPSCDTNNVACDSELVTVGESGCALPPEDHSFHAIMFQGGPKTIAVNIEHESGTAFHYQGAAEQKCFYPNGEGCDPRPCCSAVMSTKVIWE